MKAMLIALIVAVVALGALACLLALRISDLKWQVKNLQEWIEHDRQLSKPPPIPTIDVPTEYFAK